ncbi:MULTISPECIES: sensor histidine kinase [Tenacibaculum]|uniref:sensor histidine kinase n=1 Tax=Tenacibaculum TaxID=104267 RepID=UPI001F0B5B72|nr:MULTISPECIES: histidine kinase [Tenacibaculum]MCH3881815.1 histidine kinase [Tenacibaculum aquimarinum]MDO6598617.1 histidine kinase [Tenacibaculum sp. 1_MG-2023]
MKKSTPILTVLITVAIHLCFWVGIYFFYNYFLGYGSNNVEYINRFSLFLMPITIVVSYFFLYYLVPTYLVKKQQNLFVLYSIYTFIVSYFFVVVSIFFGLIFSDYLKSEDITPITKGFLFIILGVYFVIFIVITFGMFIHNYKQSIKNEDLKNKFLQTQLQLKEQELKFLKMQIHPHFLFNSLNTIYGFALKKADKAPEMILKLSNLLDYILYQVEKPAVLLQDEIDHLKDYVSLEKMRFHDTLEVQISEEGNAKNVQIAPMLLIPFVENSFKHGAIIDGKLNVTISIIIENGFLFFKITNSTSQEVINEIGIGLENIKKRLEMLYPNGHQLKIEQENQLFVVALKMKINSLNILKNDY